MSPGLTLSTYGDNVSSIMLATWGNLPVGRASGHATAHARAYALTHATAYPLKLATWGNLTPAKGAGHGDVQDLRLRL
jgi:hypothetical protein